MKKTGLKKGLQLEILSRISDAVIVTDIEHNVSYMNHAAEKLYDITLQDTAGKKLEEVFHFRWLRPIDEKEIRDAVAQKGYWAGENVHVTQSGKELNVRVYLTDFKDKQGQPAVLLAIMQDITDLRKAEEQIRFQEQLINDSADAIYMADMTPERKLIIRKWNKGAENMYGWKENEVKGKWIDDVLQSKILGEATQKVAMARLVTKGYWSGEQLVKRKDGSELITISTLSLMKDSSGAVIGAMGIHKDITHRKRMEEALQEQKQKLWQMVKERTADLEKLADELSKEVIERENTEKELRELYHRMVRVQEEERRSVSRELHDEIGQALTILNLTLARLQSSIAATARATLTEAQGMVTKLSAQIRTLSSSLHPAMLETLGLVKTLNWYFNEFTKRTGIQVRFEHTDLEDRDFTPEIRITVYRIIQEALTNATRYSGAKEVDVRLKVRQKMLNLSIEDRGRGFDPAAVRATSSGIRGMRERTISVGGSLKVKSAPGAGTRISAELPLARAKAE